MNLKDMVDSIREDGFKLNRAKVKACQEIFMIKLSCSKYRDSVLLKGGTIMYQLTKEQRRSTEDLDVDLMKISVSDQNLITVFNRMGAIDVGLEIKFEVIVDKITSLKHEAYEGKRLILLFTDDLKDTLSLKLDIGIHTQYHIEQDKLIFDITCSDKGIELLANPIEQMIVEKTSSFIKFGVLSTRMKDLFDIYYLIKNQTYSKQKVMEIIHQYFVNPGQAQSLDHYINSMTELLKSDIFIGNFSRSDNWTGCDINTILEELTLFFNGIK
ncbi:MAG: nucleotidyl transferase AbiEii/AbiGii toxin family protein [Firmicutes bacterium]|nr:nucleotidyl transferase AbiEii/AbiGii toxin family protein [Bacillota bacterium]